MQDAVAQEAGDITQVELRLAARNHGMPLEAMRYDVTPVGLHYLLIHYDIPVIDATEWRLRVDGCVGRPLELSLEDLRALPAVSRRATMECAGNGRALLDPRPLSQPWLNEAVGTGEWTGVALADVISGAGLAPEAVELVFTGADRGVEGGVEQQYQRSLPAAAASDRDVLLAHALNGQPLPPQHGFPLRLIVPGWYGMTNVKWLTAITAVETPFSGMQQVASYRVRQTSDEPGVPVTRMVPRALMVPPGIPEFPTRGRFVTAGNNLITGRAWSGFAAITEVRLSRDGGETWERTQLSPPSALGVWQAWSYEWAAEPGIYELCCRAVDAEGNEQPLEPNWNVGGYSNNAVQRVGVEVRPPPV